MTIERINRDVSCRYCPTRAVVDVTKEGDRPTPECAEHLDHSVARYLLGE